MTASFAGDYLATMPKPTTRDAALTLAILFGLAFASCRKEETPPQDSVPQASQSASGPAIEVASPSHDFGKVMEGEKLQHVFTIKNAGDQPLTIENVSTSCGCTAAAPKEKVVQPGASTEIEVSFSTESREGKQHKVVTVTSNDPKNRRTSLAFDAEIVPQLAFTPHYLRVTGKAGSAASAEAWLTGTLAANAKPTIEEITGDRGVTAAIVERSAGNNVERGVKLTMPGKKVERGHGAVVVATGVKEKPQLRLSFGYEASGNLTVPEQIYLNPSQENLRERTIPVKSSLENFVLQAASVQEGPFRASVSKGKDGFEVRVTAQPPPNQKGTIRGKMVLVSNDPLEPRKEIRLSLGEPRRTPTPRSSASGRP